MELDELKKSWNALDEQLKKEPISVKIWRIWDLI